MPRLPALFCALPLCLPAAAAVAAEPPLKARPNFVIVLADDLGYGDLGCFGKADARTPHLDRFAGQGLRLTDCYSAGANCSPSRAGLLTGRTPYRPGIHNWIPQDSPMHLRRSELTVATLLRRAGWATAHVGKWHLNGDFNGPSQPQPPEHGFDWWFSTQNNALPCHRDPDNFIRNGKPVGALKGHSAQIVTDEALRWLNDHRDKEKPFFLYVCYHEPHEPIATDPVFAAQHPSDDPRQSAHHGNITQLDFHFGRLMKALDDAGLTDNTFVLFTSDNGPAVTPRHPYGSAGPLRDKKGALYEGGIRVPGIIRFPGRTGAGSVSSEPVCGVDLLPTLCEIAGVPAPTDRAIDGASFTPVFAGRTVQRRTPLYWQFVVARGGPKAAVRIGRYKVLAALTGPEVKPFGDIRPEDQQTIKTAEPDRFELYDLVADPGEKNDLAAREPETLRRMAEALRAMHMSVREESPTWPAWTWTRVEGPRIKYPEEPKFPR
jgi:arylsulfatase A